MKIQNDSILNASNPSNCMWRRHLSIDPQHVRQIFEERVGSVSSEQRHNGCGEKKSDGGGLCNGGSSFEPDGSSFEPVDV